MKIYIVVGEASGDLHGANLMKALFNECPSAEIRFFGGDLMKAVGGTLVSHYKERAFMGFAEVLFNLRKISTFINLCKKDISLFNPDVVIFIDNSGFNLRIAKWAKAYGFKTHYYIAPQVWASRPGRVKDIKRDVDELYVILPFEQEFYEQFNYDVNFVGHPLIDAIDSVSLASQGQIRNRFHLGEKPIIALLPGSRKQEISKILGYMLCLIDSFPDYQFVVGGAPGQKKEFYQQIINGKNVIFVDNATYDLLSISHAAIVTSGTATLEAALFKVPQVVCYKTSWLTYQIAKQIINLKYISLVNLILDRKVVTELIQSELNADRLKESLLSIVDGNFRQNMLKDYKELEIKLGGGGASKRVAKKILAKLS